MDRAFKVLFHRFQTMHDRIKTELLILSLTKSELSTAVIIIIIIIIIIIFNIYIAHFL